MLTGDKFDTAVQIATACAMRKPNGLLVEITANDIEEMHSNLKVCQLKCKRYSTGESGDGYFDSNDVCLVIRGDRLDLALDDYNKKDFIKLIISAKSVVCCRFTPLQKAQIVGLVKDEGHMTLAIGDGGNDVSMIQKAHIGVGIRGKEGLQAARAADYQINYFRYLKRLLLVHGHYSIRRTGFISEYSYYKSLLFCLFQVMYGFYTGFSGNSIFNGGCITAYNMLLFFPIVSFCLDKDLDHNYLMDHPYAYTHTALGHDFNWRTFSRWIIRAVIQGLVIFFCSIAAFSSNYSATSGYAVDYDVLGYVVFFAYLWTQSITLVIELKYIAKINITAIWGFHFLALLIMFASSLVRSFDSLSPYYAGYVSLLDPILWLTNVLVTVFAIFPVILEKYVSFNYSPTIIQKLYAASILKKYDLPSSTIQQAVTPEADTL
jgi:magnesium-transporting ATPase (P-type)